MKVTVIGGGSTYTPELINGFLERTSTLPVTELWLMDIDAARLAIVGGFAQRIVEAKGNPFKVVLTGDQQAAIQGALVCHHPITRGADACPGGGRIPWAAAWLDRSGDHRCGRHGQSHAYHPGYLKNRG